MINLTIGVKGLGYVGLPLVVEFGKYRKTLAFDIDKNRISELEADFDRIDFDVKGFYRGVR